MGIVLSLVPKIFCFGKLTGSQHIWILIWIKEANSHDRINMTKNWLEFDRKFVTMANLNNWIWQNIYSVMWIHLKLRQQYVLSKFLKIWNSWKSKYQALSNFDELNPDPEEMCSKFDWRKREKYKLTKLVLNRFQDGRTRTQDSKKIS